MLISSAVRTFTPRQSKKWFSNAVNEERAKLFPTRHSRHLPPPACLNLVQLHEVTQEILETSPGMLIPYRHSERDDSFFSWQLADHSVQKVEWLMRGYSAHVKNSSMNYLFGIDVHENPETCIQNMQKLIQKIEKEGKLYMDVRMKTRSQLALESQNKDLESDNSLFPKLPNIMFKFAPPGLTVCMFDTIFDTMSVASDSNTPDQIGQLWEKVKQRHELDGGTSYNANPNTTLSQLTLNACLRAIANSPNTSDKTRDDAMINGFMIFRGIHETGLIRNSATYAYMIKLISNFMPPSQMAGNIAHALWILAVNDKVVDNNVMRALELVDAGDYTIYSSFLERVIKGKTVNDVPKDWLYNKDRFRYVLKDDKY